MTMGLFSISHQPLRCHPIACGLTAMIPLGMAVWLAALTGCAGYQIGNGTLYASNIRTVYVPMFESASFRRNLGERLTEAVVKEIELKTPFKVVSTPDADSILSGRITSDTKRMVVENRWGDVREVEVSLRVKVQWIDRQNNAILGQEEIPLDADTATVQGTASVLPEMGQSVATAHQKAIQRVAQRIVAMMETPW